MKIIADKYSVDITEKENLISGNVNNTQVSFDLSSDFDNLVVRAVFGNQFVTVTNNQCYVPELVVGKIKVGVYGYEVEDNELKIRVSPKYTFMYVESGSYSADDVEADSPSPTELENHYQLINELVESGKLKGDTGPQGPAGADGKDGTDGKNGTDGKDYILTAQDKSDISELAKYDDKPIKNEISVISNSKVDKIAGKTLTSNDFTNELKIKVENLSNYDDTGIKENIKSLDDSKQDFLTDEIKQEIVEQFENVKPLSFDSEFINYSDLPMGFYQLQNDVLIKNKNGATRSANEYSYVYVGQVASIFFDQNEIYSFADDEESIRFTKTTDLEELQKLLNERIDENANSITAINKSIKNLQECKQDAPQIKYLLDDTLLINTIYSLNEIDSSISLVFPTSANIGDSIEVMFETSDTPPTITTENVYGLDDISLNANCNYDILASWNGTKWIGLANEVEI